MIQRRDFITFLGGGAAAWPLAAEAQQRTMPVVGFIHPGSAEAIPKNLSAFLKGLSEAGFVEGRNVMIEYRWAHNESARLREFATDLASRRVAVIVTPGSTPAALAAKAATMTIPVVFSVGGDPVQSGLVPSFSRPGGNVTGFSEMNTEVVAKRLGVIRELVPGAARFAVLSNPTTPLAAFSSRDAQVAAATVGRPIEVVTASTSREIDTAFESLTQNRIDAILVNPSVLFYDNRAQLATLAERHKIPAIYWDRAFAEAGGLMSYGSSVAELFRQVGIYAGRILKGEKPADLPVQQATKFEFVINLKAAKVLGIDVPPTLIALTDEVIE